MLSDVRWPSTSPSTLGRVDWNRAGWCRGEPHSLYGRSWLIVINFQGKQSSQQHHQVQDRDSNQLSTKDIQQELHSRTGSDLSDLPPAIASFMNRVRQNSAGSVQEMRPPDEQSRPSAFSPPTLAHATTTMDQHHQQSWQQQQQHQHLQDQQQRHYQQFQDQRHQQQQHLQDQHLQDQHQHLQDQHQQQRHHQHLQDQHQYHQQQLQDQHQQQQQSQQYQQPMHSLPNESIISEAHSQLRNMPPDGSSTRSSLQENSGMDKDLSTPDFTDSSSLSSGEDEERRETSSFLSYTNSLPRPTRQHHPITGAMQIGNPRNYMQQSHFNSYPHSLPPSNASYGGRMDNMHGFMRGRHHAPSSVVSATSSYHQQQPFNHSAHMYNHLADRPHIDRQLLERQQMDRLQAMERQKQMERQVPMSRPNPMEFDRQFQYPSSQPPPVPSGTQRPQPLYPRGSQEWSPNINVGRQRNFPWQQEDEALKERQVEAQRRLMQQENSRHVHMMPQQGVYHADSLQHLHMLPNHSSANDGVWSPHRHPLNYHSMDHGQEQHMGPYLHQSGGRHSYSAAPSGRDILGPPPSMYHHHQQQGSFQRPPHHRVAHHSSYSGGQQPPPQNHEQSDKKNLSVIQV